MMVYSRGKHPNFCFLNHSPLGVPGRDRQPGAGRIPRPAGGFLTRARAPVRSARPEAQYIHAPVLWDARYMGANPYAGSVGQANTAYGSRGRATGAIMHLPAHARPRGSNSSVPLSRGGGDGGGALVVCQRDWGGVAQ